MKHFIATICCFFLLSPQLFAHWQIVFSAPLIPLQGGAYFQETEVKSAGIRARVYAVFFNERNCRLDVLDNPPIKAKNLETILKQRGYFAGVNGGYFHANLAPVGLVVSNKQILNPSEKAPLLSGILEIHEKSIRLIRTDEFRFSNQLINALQAGPFLINRGQIVRGLNATRAARRTIVASDGHGNWALISMTPLTLAQVGEVLATRHIFKWVPWNALNLDGGSSTAFWAATKPMPFSIHEFSIVRNFLGLTQLH